MATAKFQKTNIVRSWIGWAILLSLVNSIGCSGGGGDSGDTSVDPVVPTAAAWQQTRSYFSRALEGDLGGEDRWTCRRPRA